MTFDAPALRFRVGGLPVPEGSMSGYLRGGKIRIVPQNQKALKRWRGDVAKACEITLLGDLAWKPMTGPVMLALTFGFARPVSHPKGRTTWPTGKGTTGDVDKLARAVLDALTGLAYRDDAQVVTVLAAKDWCGQGVARHLTLPGAVVRAWRIDTETPSTGQLSLLGEQEPSQ